MPPPARGGGDEALQRTRRDQDDQGCASAARCHVRTLAADGLPRPARRRRIHAEIPKSIGRKAARAEFWQQPRYARAWAGGRTAWKAYALFVGGELIVQEVIVTVEAARPAPPASPVCARAPARRLASGSLASPRAAAPQLRRIRAGDRRALQRLFRQTVQTVSRAALCRTGAAAGVSAVVYMLPRDCPAWVAYWATCLGARGLARPSRHHLAEPARRRRCRHAGWRYCGQRGRRRKPGPVGEGRIIITVVTRKY